MRPFLIALALLVAGFFFANSHGVSTVQPAIDQRDAVPVTAVPAAAPGRNEFTQERSAPRPLDPLPMTSDRWEIAARPDSMVGEFWNNAPISIPDEQRLIRVQHLDHKGYEDRSGRIEIHGHIRNPNTETAYQFMDVSYNIFNGRGERVGTARASSQNVKPREIWEYTAIGFASDPGPDNTFEVAHYDCQK